MKTKKTGDISYIVDKEPISEDENGFPLYPDEIEKDPENSNNINTIYINFQGDANTTNNNVFENKEDFILSNENND